MQNNSIFITNSGIDQVSGGGIVGFNLVEALRSSTDLKLILSNQKFQDDRYAGIPALTVNPFDYDYKFPSPFFIDYLMYHMLPDDTTIELAQMYAGPFGITTEKLKKDYFCKVIVDLAPHNIEISKEEHERLGGTFNYPHLLNPWLWDIYMKHLRLADLVIVHSKKSASYIKEKAKLSETPMVIPHGCNLVNIEPLPKRFTVGHLSQLGADKSQVDLLLAWEKLKPSNMDLIIAGPGTEAWNEFIQERNIPNAKAIGRVNDVNDFYKKCSVYVQSSSTEGFGIPVLEAASHGRPIIVTDETGASELIQDGSSGFIIPIRSPESIADKILYFYDNVDEIKRIGANARRVAEQNTWEIIRRRYEEIYEKVLD